MPEDLDSILGIAPKTDTRCNKSATNITTRLKWCYLTGSYLGFLRVIALLHGQGLSVADFFSSGLGFGPLLFLCIVRFPIVACGGLLGLLFGLFTLPFSPFTKASSKPTEKHERWSLLERTLWLWTILGTLVFLSGMWECGAVLLLLAFFIVWPLAWGLAEGILLVFKIGYQQKAESSSQSGTMKAGV